MKGQTRMPYLKEQVIIVTNLSRMIKKEFEDKMSWKLAVSMAYEIAVKVEDKRISGGM